MDNIIDKMVGKSEQLGEQRAKAAQALRQKSWVQNLSAKMSKKKKEEDGTEEVEEEGKVEEAGEEKPEEQKA